MMVVEVKSSKHIHIIVGYRPQENLPVIQKMTFFVAKLEEETVSAKMVNKSIIIQLDANSKLGKEIITDYPKYQSPNSVVLEGIVNGYGLIGGYSLEAKVKVKGLITTKRVTVDGIEESIID